MSVEKPRRASELRPWRSFCFGGANPGTLGTSGNSLHVGTRPYHDTTDHMHDGTATRQGNLLYIGMTSRHTLRQPQDRPTLHSLNVLHGVPNADQLQVILHLLDVEVEVHVEHADTKLTRRQREWPIAFACLEGKAGGEAVRSEHRGDDVPFLWNVLSSRLESRFRVGLLFGV